MSGSARRRALVTGGAGFIGSHIVDALVDDGWAVRVLDNFSTGCEENLTRAQSRIEILRGDVRDPRAVEEAVSEVDVVFHQGAVSSVASTIADPVSTHRVNVEGTLLVLEAARSAGVGRVVYASSSAAYGESEEIPKVEDMPVDPRSPYAAQKCAAEVYCRLYGELYGLEVAVLRYFNVFGPRQNTASDYAAVVPRFIQACLDGAAPRVHGDGRQTRDFVFVADAVRASLLAAESAKAAGAVVNVGSGRQTAVIELLELVREITGSRVEPVHEPPRVGDVRRSCADLRRACRTLDFEPAVELRDGLRQTVDSFRKRAIP